MNSALTWWRSCVFRNQEQGVKSDMHKLYDQFHYQWQITQYTSWPLALTVADVDRFLLSLPSARRPKTWNYSFLGAPSLLFYR